MQLTFHSYAVFSCEGNTKEWFGFREGLFIHCSWSVCMMEKYKSKNSFTFGPKRGVSIYSSLYNLSENKIKLPYKVINGFCILDCIVKPVIHNTIQYGINLLDASNKGLHHFNTCQLWYNKGNYLEMLLDILSQYWKRDNLI